MKKYKGIRLAIGIICQYEALAIFTDRMPTITELNRRIKHHKIASVVLAGLAWHFFTQDWPFETVNGGTQ